MTRTVIDILDHLVGLFMEGRYSDMVGAFDLPLALQVGHEMMVVGSAQEFSDTMARYCGELQALGVTGLTLRQTAIELPQRARFRIWVEMDHLFGQDVLSGADQMILYCRQSEQGLRIELLQCVRLAFLEAMALSQPIRA